MKKKILVLIIIAFLTSCNKANSSKNESTEIDSLHSLKENKIKKISKNETDEENQYIENVFSQDKINFLPIYISKDKFGDEFYGLDVLGARATDQSTEYNFYDGKFKSNNEFLRFDNFDREIVQKYYLNTPKRHLTLYYKDYSLDSKLVDAGVFEMDLIPKTYGIFAIDSSVDGNISGYGSYCGFVITNTNDKEISKTYLSEIIRDLNNTSR